MMLPCLLGQHHDVAWEGVATFSFIDLVQLLFDLKVPTLICILHFFFTGACRIVLWVKKCFYNVTIMEASGVAL